jgi:hypothetical protein
MAMSAVASLLMPGVYAMAIFFFSAPGQINVLKNHRMGGDNFYGRRNSLEEDGIQAVPGSDEYSVRPVGGRQQLLSAERLCMRIAPGVVVPVDTVFNFLRKLAGDHQNWFLHVRISDFGTAHCIRSQHLHALPLEYFLGFSCLVWVRHAEQAA